MEIQEEYVVCLHDGVDYDEFWWQMEHNFPNPTPIPDRIVDIVNERPGSLRSCHYALSNTEASELRKDPRVRSVELPPQKRSDIQIRPRLVQTGNFTKSTTSTGDNLNYGLIRCVNSSNPYGTLLTTNQSYPYVLDGTGVDVVIQDSGIQMDHPEFLDRQGTTRTQNINWYSESGLPGTQNVNFYRDFDGHGTHVAGILAGSTYGWAKNARIYSMKIAGLEGAGDSGTGISVTDCFDAIKLWHLAKPITSTGYRRPTVVNMSWGYVSTFSNITGGVYRGTSWTGTDRRTDLGMVGSLFNGDYYFDVRVGSVDTDVEELLSAGVIVVTAAGNSFQKIDVSSGADWNNEFTSSLFGNIPYHRGGSPHSSQAICVGSLDSQVFDATTEQKSVFSNAGPGVHAWAPGSNIRSACSNTNSFGASTYYANTSFKQVNLSGTSMAAPQIAGMLALYLQVNSHATPAQCQAWIQSKTVNQVFTTESETDYTNNRSVWGGTTQLFILPFGQSRSLNIQGAHMQGITSAYL
jgi:serine protease